MDDAWTSPPVPEDGPHGPKGTLVVPSPFSAESPPPTPPPPRAAAQDGDPLLAPAPLSVRPPAVEPDPFTDLGPPLLDEGNAPSGGFAESTGKLWSSALQRGGDAGARARAWFNALEPTPRKLVAAAAVSSVALPLLALVIGLASRPSRSGPAVWALGSSRLSDLTALAAAGPPVETATPIAPPAGPKGPCVPTGEPKQLAPKASKDVPLEMRLNADRGEVAIGFAADAQTAAGIVVDLRTFEIRDRFRKPAAKIGRVVPVAGDQGFTFEVHAAGRAGHDQDSLTITTAPPWILSWKKDEMKLAAKDGAVATSWKLDDKPSAVRALSVPTRGAAIAYKQAESMQLAWIDPKGQPAGEMSRVQSAGTKLGAPSLAWNGSEALIAFAERESDDAPWAIRVARGGFGAAATSSRVWAAPGGGPGGPVIAPSVTDLDRGGWLMMWTEGKQGQREVRMLTCDKDLEAIGEARTVSGQGNAGQGVAVVSTGRGIAAYLTGTRTHELWGAGIECP